MEQQIVEYNITNAAIAQMSALYMGLTVAGLDDIEGFEAVHEARMVVKGKRVEVEKRRKELKADALAYGKKIDSKAKGIFALLEPIESHLQTEEDKITKEKERIKAEEDRKEQERIQKRVDELLSFKCVLPFLEVAGMSDDEYEVRIIALENAFKEEAAIQEQKRKEQEAEDIRLTNERDAIALIQEEQANKEAALKAEQDRIEAEKRAFEEEKRKEQERKDRAEFERNAKVEAQYQAEKDAAAKVVREAEAEALEKAEKAQQELWAKEEAERQAALLPDKTKLLNYADKIRELTACNLDVKTEEARHIFHTTLDNITGVEKRLRTQIEEL